MLPFTALIILPLHAKIVCSQLPRKYIPMFLVRNQYFNILSDVGCFSYFFFQMFLVSLFWSLKATTYNVICQNHSSIYDLILYIYGD